MDGQSCVASRQDQAAALEDVALRLLLLLPVRARQRLSELSLSDHGDSKTSEKAEELPSLSSQQPGLSAILSWDWREMITGIDKVVLMVCFSMLLYMIRVLYKERSRYSKLVMLRDQFSSYLKYRFSIWYGRTAEASFIVLTFLCMVLLVAGGMLHSLLTDDPVSVSLWKAWIWIAAPDGGASADTFYGRIAGAIMSCGGMLIFALLMSLVSAHFEEMLEMFKHVGLPVIEGGHTVILGWNPLLPFVVGEICTAYESDGGRVIAILTNIGKNQVESLLEDSGVDFKNSIIVVRTGDRRRAADLQVVGAQAASQILVLSRHDVPREDADARQLNVLSSLQAIGLASGCKVVVQCQLANNAEFLGYACNLEQCLPIVTGNFLGALMVQSTLQSGLAQASIQILGFEDNEFYIERVQGTAGKTFRDLLFGLRGAIPIGIATAERLILVPSMNHELKGTEKIIMFAEDVATLPNGVCESMLAGAATLPCFDGSIASQRLRGIERETSSETVVIIGWNECMGYVLAELDKILMAGSVVHIFSPCPVDERQTYIKSALKRRSKTKFGHFEMKHFVGPTTARTSLEELPLGEASKILILADSESAVPRDADGISVAVASQVMDIVAKVVSSPDNERLPPVIVAQVLLQSTEPHFRNMGLQDFILSEKLAASICAQVVVNNETHVISEELLSAQGSCELHIRNAMEYLACLSPLESRTESCKDFTGCASVSFEKVKALAATAGEIALGWRSNFEPEKLWDMNPQDQHAREITAESASVVVIRKRDSHKRLHATNSLQEMVRPNLSKLGACMTMKAMGDQIRRRRQSKDLSKDLGTHMQNGKETIATNSNDVQPMDAGVCDGTSQDEARLRRAPHSHLATLQQELAQLKKSVNDLEHVAQKRRSSTSTEKHTTA